MYAVCQIEERSEGFETRINVVKRPKATTFSFWMRKYQNIIDVAVNYVLYCLYQNITDVNVRL